MEAAAPAGPVGRAQTKNKANIKRSLGGGRISPKEIVLGVDSLKPSSSFPFPSHYCTQQASTSVRSDSIRDGSVCDVCVPLRRSLTIVLYCLLSLVAAPAQYTIRYTFTGTQSLLTLCEIEN